MFKKIKQWLTLKPQNANKLAKKEQLKHAAILLLVGGASYGFYCYSSAEKKSQSTRKKLRSRVFLKVLLTRAVTKHSFCNSSNKLIL